MNKFKPGDKVRFNGMTGGVIRGEPTVMYPVSTVFGFVYYATEEQLSLEESDQ